MGGHKAWKYNYGYVRLGRKKACCPPPNPRSRYCGKNMPSSIHKKVQNVLDPDLLPLHQTHVL